ncbi:MAG: DDE-type integrase/transposase/recombinase [Candidatus Eisenbacteria bacterium]|nr:DDE-type integrase/transposase/recombinase [Candidatus Eisenbacteria bacterium]
MYDPWAIATWRFEQLSPLLDSSLSRAERRRYLMERSTRPVAWPHSGKGPAPYRPIARSTLARWLQIYRREGLCGLLPKPRERDKPDRSELVAYALALLAEEPERSLAQLLLYIQLEFPDAQLSRSTLHRELLNHPAYTGLTQGRRTIKPRKLRDLYQTERPHVCWQLDGKGPFRVAFADGSHRRLHVLSILEDFSRYILAAMIAASENLPAAVRVLRLALAKFGLPERFQFDRGSAFDSIPVRTGLALLGVHRNWVESRAPEAQGKIEAYHRVLHRWFLRELRHQVVHDVDHLEALLQAFIDLFYNRHRHRELKMSPHDALAGRLSSRRVSPDDLGRAFWVSLRAKSHPKTGDLSLPNGRFRVPARFAGKPCRFRYDPVEPDRAVLLVGRDQELEIKPFAIRRAFPRHGDTTKPLQGTGQLQKLLDVWHGRERPNALPGFGLPEVFRELGRLLGHLTPQDEREARTITTFYREFGPLATQPFRDALDQTRRALGDGRPLSTYLDHLSRLLRAAQRIPSSPNTTKEVP